MHEPYLTTALQLAATRRGFCAPNPAVGAIIVRDGQVLATGCHMAAGLAHAEVNAIENCRQTAGATLYVTLEPCCHYGKTPPCTDLIIKSGITKVIYAYPDPNPVVAGLGAQRLREAGIQTQLLHTEAIDNFYQSYHHWQQTKLPYVTAKIALSLDGKIAEDNGKPAQLTGEQAAQFTHLGRKHSDAILTTSQTIINDDPKLNVRLANEVYNKPIYILDSQLRLPLTAKIFETSDKITVFHNESANEKQYAALAKKDVQLVAVPRDKYGLKLPVILQHIGEQGMHDLWVEAGGYCFSSLIQQGLLNKAYIYLAPKVLGTEAYSAFNDRIDLLKHAKAIKWQSLGEDVLCELRWQ